MKDMAFVLMEVKHLLTHKNEGNFSYSTLARNVIIFGADMSFSKHANNKANNIYVMDKDHIQKSNDTTTYAEKNFHTNFTRTEKKFVLSLHYYNDDSYLFVNGRQELQFKTKNDQMSIEKNCVSVIYLVIGQAVNLIKLGYRGIFMILL